MTYDSASALSAASGQLQHRATAANPLALKPWVVPIKTARSPELAHGYGWVKPLPLHGSSLWQLGGALHERAGRVESALEDGLPANGVVPELIVHTLAAPRADQVSQPPHGVILGQLVQYAGLSQARQDVPPVLVFLLGNARFCPIQEHLFRDSLLLAEAPRVLAQVRGGHCGVGDGLALEHLASAAEAQELGDGRVFAQDAKERLHVPLRRVPLQRVPPGQLLRATKAGGQAARARPDEDSLLGDPSQRRHELLAHDAAVAPPLGKRSPTRDPTALLRHMDVVRQDTDFRNKQTVFA